MRSLSLFAIALSWTGLASMASAQGVPNHLACVKFKDTIPKAVYTADMFSFPGISANGCLIKTPAKLVCPVAFKNNINPLPPGFPGPQEDIYNSGAIKYFFCYKAKCPKTSYFISASDQFGTRSGITTPPVAPKMICAPASPSGAFLEE
jgi:hypothetical protein